MINLSVIIPTHNRKALLYNTLSQLKEQLIKTEGLLYNIVVVMDGSVDGTREMLKTKFKDVHIVEGNGTWWYTKSMNEGFRFSNQFNPDYILTLNDDVVLTANYLNTLLEIIKHSKNDMIVGSLSYIDTCPPKVFFSGVKRINKKIYKQIRYHKTFSEINPIKLSGIYPSMTLPGRGMLIPYHILKRLHYFDEKFPQYGSDDDFVLRAWEHGYKAFISYDSQIISLPEYTSNGAPHNKPSFGNFLYNMFFNKYSSTYFFKNLRMIYRHGSKIFFPFTIIYQLLATINSYYKYKRLNN